MKAQIARISMALTILASMALVTGAGIKWSASANFLSPFGF